MGSASWAQSHGMSEVDGEAETAWHMGQRTGGPIAAPVSPCRPSKPFGQHHDVNTHYTLYAHYIH